MKSEVVQRVQYVEDYGPVNQGGRGISPEYYELFDRLRKASIVDYLVVEPEEGENIVTIRKHLTKRLRMLAVKFSAKFRVRVALNREANHVVVWKEALPQ